MRTKAEYEREYKKRKQAQKLIIEALNLFEEPAAQLTEADFPAEWLSSNRYHELTREQIDHGVAAFIFLNNMKVGSDSQVELYNLLKEYLLNLDFRHKLHDLIGQLGRKC